MIFIFCYWSVPLNYILHYNFLCVVALITYFVCLIFYYLFNNIFCAADFLIFVIYLTTYFVPLIFYFWLYATLYITFLTKVLFKKNCSHNINTYTYLTLECDTLLNLFDVAFKKQQLNYNDVQGDFQFFIAYLLLV